MSPLRPPLLSSSSSSLPRLQLQFYHLRALQPQQTATRTITTTPSRRKGGPLPTILPTQSTPLNDLLNTFRTNIFLPAHLHKSQRDLIYRRKHQHLLTGDEPATASIAGEIVQMRPLDRLRDEPATDPSIARVLQLMRETGHWGNLPGFLAGLQTARRKPKGWQMERVARKACLVGKEGLVVQCVRSAEITGLGLWEVGVVRELMWAAMRRAQAGAWRRNAVERGLLFAEMVWVLLQDPKQAVPRGSGLVNPRGRSEVVGVLLQLHAAMAIVTQGGTEGVKVQDEGKRVGKYVRLLLASWDNARLGVTEKGDDHEANRQLMRWAPVWHGMKLAREVLGKDSSLGRELTVKLCQVEPVLQKAQERVLLAQTAPATPADLAHQEEGIRRGVKVYDDLSAATVSS